MPLFKEQVALEACPAKTAESVSYAATFTVLGWLLVSNYSVLSTEQVEDITVADTTAANSYEAGSVDARRDYLATYIGNYSASEGSSSESLLPLFAAEAQLESEEISESIDSQLAALSAWHSELDQSRPTQLRNKHDRVAASASWHNSTRSAAQQYTQNFIADLQPSLELTELDYSLDNYALEELKADTGPPADIREITVTGTDAERNANRPSHIQRPQIPRAFRALEAQRSFILPPRIQALRP